MVSSISLSLLYEQTPCYFDFLSSCRLLEPLQEQFLLLFEFQQRCYLFFLRFFSYIEYWYKASAFVDDDSRNVYAKFWEGMHFVGCS